MLNLMRENEGGAEDEAGDQMDMDDVLRRLIGRFQPGAAQDAAPSPQIALDERLYQAVRAGDLEEAKKAHSAGTKSFSQFSPFCLILLSYCSPKSYTDTLSSF